MADAIAAIKTCDPEVVIVSAHLLDLDEISFSLLKRELLAHRGIGGPYRVVGVAVIDEEKTRLLRHGCSSVIDFDPTNATALIKELTEVMVSKEDQADEYLENEPIVSEREAGKSNVVVVMGTAGAPGRTSIAIGLASELARAGHQTLLIDVDLASPAISLLLGGSGETPGLAAACRLAERDSLTEQTLRHAARRLADGLWLLAGTGIISPPEGVHPRALQRVLEVAQASFDSVVVDSGYAPADSGEVARSADTILVCALPTPLGLTRLVAMLSELSDLGLRGTVHVVLNKCPKPRLKSLVSEVRQLLRTHASSEPVVGVALDRRGFARAEQIGSANAFIGLRSPARRSFRRLRDSLKSVTY